MKKTKFTKNKKPIYLSIGTFDGVHLGHQKILNVLLKKAKSKDVEKAVLTFYPHPFKVVKPTAVPKMISSLRHRIEIIFSMGFDSVYVMEFNKWLSSFSPEQFINTVVKDKLNAKEVFVGEDFALGKYKHARVPFLNNLFKQNLIKLNVINNKTFLSKAVSSTQIRKHILSGDVKKAQKLLGRSYSILGKVIHGDRIGRKIGFPTANIEPYNEAIPHSGAYAVKILYNKREFQGIANIGFRPTIKKENKKQSIEVHIFDFDKDIYGKGLEIFFIKRLRDEKHFRDVCQLKSQIEKDIKRVKKLL